jgi:hypothetical protein
MIYVFYYFKNFINQLFKNKYILLFLNYCIIQNIISIAIFPLYSSWGIPFSTLSLLGNLLFSPFLLIYLLFSFIIFISFFLQKWSAMIIACQKYILTLWIYLMSTLSNLIPFKMIVFIDMPELSYILCWGAACILLYIKSNMNNTALMTLYSFIGFFLVLSILVMIPKKHNITIIQDNNLFYAVCYKNEREVYLHAIDKKRKYISEKKMEYTFVPQIRKIFGNNELKINLI